MPRKDETKDREYYLNECCRLRSRLKNAENNKFESKYYALRNQIKTKDKEIDKLKKQNLELLAKLKEYHEQNKTLIKEHGLKDKKFEKLQQLMSEKENEIDELEGKSSIKRQCQSDKTIESLKTQNKALVKDINLQRETIERLQGQIRELLNKQIAYKLETNTYKEIVVTMTTKNKRIFADYLETIDKPDEVRISFATIMLDLEYIFSFVKLFEMHVFDYIVDRQDPRNKTELDNVELIATCKQFTTDTIERNIYNEKLDIKRFKQGFKEWCMPYLEPETWVKSANLGTETSTSEVTRPEQ